MATIAVDTSLLIALARLELIDLLPQLFDEVVVPTAVLEEALRGTRASDEVASINAAVEAGHLKPVEVVVPAADPWSATLGHGERAVLSLAATGAVDFVGLDDRAARRAATTAGLQPLGTIGILVRARHVGLISSALPFVERLRATGFRIGDDLIEALRTDEQP